MAHNIEKKDLDERVLKKSKEEHLIRFRGNVFNLNFIPPLHKIWNRPGNIQTQYENFYSSMNFFLICSQCIGLLPIIGTSGNTTPHKRYFSWRYILCYTVCCGQILATLLCFHRLVSTSVSITTLAFFSFYSSTCITSILFVRLSARWHYLTKQVETASLNEYVDTCVKFKCSFATILILVFSILEHIFLNAMKLAIVQDCYTEVDVYKEFIISSFPWIFDLGVPYSLFFGIFLSLFNLATTLNWSFLHLFVISISYYLTSILEKINEIIISHDGEYMPSSYWQKLREDYNRATRLVRCFDDVINSIVFSSFATSLFFVCLQLYYVFAYGIKIKHGIPGDLCPNYPSGLFGGFEHVLYFTFSLTYVILRSLAVSLIVARVHTASLAAAPALYNVPSPSYCTEIQRFVDQIHGDKVALTGLNFFYVTKQLVLSVVGTIVTYELVLLQFNG